MHITQDVFAPGEVMLRIDYGAGKRVVLRFLNVAGAAAPEGEHTPAEDVAIALVRDFAQTAITDIEASRVHFRTHE